MSETLEIRSELTLVGIEQIKNDLAAVKQRFEQGDSARETAQKGFGEWLSTAHQLAGVLGVNLASVYEKVKLVGAEFISAGENAESGDQAIAALLATTQGQSFDKAIKNAEQLGDRLDDIAIGAGVSGEALGDAFQTVVERTGATESGIKRATEEVEKLAIISSNLNKDTGAITSEYSLMQEGMLKTKGQLFQLLQSTGIFGTKTKGVSEAWAALTDEKRAELLNYGLSKLSDKMRDMPPTFKQAQASLDNMLRIGKENIGQPLIEELTPALQDVTQEIMRLGPDISEIGHALAKEVGGGIREGGRMMREALSWVKDHKGEIAADIRSAADRVKSVFEFVLAHKEEIGIALGVKTAMPVLKPIAGGIADAYSAGASGAGGGVRGFAAIGMAGGVASVVALTAAVISLGLAADQTRKLVAELEDQEDTRLGGLRKLQEVAASGDVEQTKNAAESMRAIDEAAGRMNPKLKEFYDSVIRTAQRARDTKTTDHEMLAKQIALGARGSADADAMGGVGGKGASADVQNYAMNQVSVLTNAYNEAMKQGDRGMALLAAQTLAQGHLVGEAFLKANQDVEGGLDAMADLLASSGSQFADFANKVKSKSAAPPAPKIVMPGAKITMVQDFRDKDPDKIAVVLKRDLARAIDRKTSARYSGVFGY